MVETDGILIQFLPDESSALDDWIARQPRPRPSRREAVRTLFQLGLRARAHPTRPPARPLGLPAPGLVWELNSGRWLAFWKAQARFVKRGYPVTRATLDP